MKELFNSITKKEWLFVIFLSLAVIFITTAPAVYGWLKTPADKVFTGMHFVSADDWFVYYSFINQGKAGQLLFTDLFAPVEHFKVFRPEWLAVGILAKIFNLSAPAALHLARILLIPVFFAVAYLFLAYIFKEEIKRKVASLFLAFSSGLGIFFIYRLIQYPSNYGAGTFQWPMDLWVPDNNTFLSLFVSPHLIAAATLVFLIFLSLLLFCENYRYRLAVFAGFCGLALFSFHPFQVLKIYALIGGFFLVLIIKAKKIIRPLVWFGLIFFFLSLPSVLYYLWLLKFDDLTVQRALQNINPTTPLYLTLISFGGLLVFAALGIWFLIKQKKIRENKYLFLAVWAAGQLALLYAPINYQRRLGLGIHFPLAALTVIALFYLYEKNQAWVKKWAGLLAITGAFVFLSSTLFALSAEVMVFSQERELSYISRDLHDSIIWFSKNSPDNSVAFSDYKTGLVLPAYVLRTSYVAHAVETPFYFQKKKEPAWFFSENRRPETEKDFLNRRRINYIIYGPTEREFGSYDPAGKPYLELVYGNETVEIYKVVE